MYVCRSHLGMLITVHCTCTLVFPRDHNIDHELRLGGTEDVGESMQLFLVALAHQSCDLIQYMGIRVGAR